MVTFRNVCKVRERIKALILGGGVHRVVLGESLHHINDDLHCPIILGIGGTGDGDGSDAMPPKPLT